MNLTRSLEVDETFIGGLAKNMHKHVRAAKIHGRGPTDKTAVMGILERKGEVRAFVVTSRKKKPLQSKVRENVEPGSEVFTDTLRSYEGLSPEYAHEAVNHAETYVRGKIHTNGMENFWSLLKRSSAARTLRSLPSISTATSTNRFSASMPGRVRTADVSSQSRLTQSVAGSPTKS